MVEFDEDGDGQPEADSGWRELCDGPNSISLRSPSSRRWRLRLVLAANELSNGPMIRWIHLKAQY